MITLSAIWPQVSSVTSGMASSIEATVWVAPNSIAFSRLNSTGSTAMTRLAPAILAPWTAFMPMPPMPTTTTVSPGFVPARLDGRAPAGGHAARHQADGRRAAGRRRP